MLREHVRKGVLAWPPNRPEVRRPSSCREARVARGAERLEPQWTSESKGVIRTFASVRGRSVALPTLGAIASTR